MPKDVHSCRALHIRANWNTTLGAMYQQARKQQ